MTRTGQETNQTMTNTIASIADRAMLVSLNITGWSARRTDKKVNAEVADKHNLKSKVGNYNKSLLPNCAAFDNVTSMAGALRNTLYHYTLPWMDNGTRILLAAGYELFAQAVKAKTEEYDRAVNAFLAEYPAHVEQARQDLNGLFDPADYPTVDALRGKFKATLKTFPMPDSQDFRVSLSSEAVSLIRESIEESVKSACEDASRDAWTRVGKALAAMQERLTERLKDPKTVYRDTLFSNIAELVEILPALNITEDPALTKIAADIKAQILRGDTNQSAVKMTAQINRDSPDRCQTTAAAVDALLSQIPAELLA